MPRPKKKLPTGPTKDGLLARLKLTKSGTDSHDPKPQVPEDPPEPTSDAPDAIESLTAHDPPSDAAEPKDPNSERLEQSLEGSDSPDPSHKTLDPQPELLLMPEESTSEGQDPLPAADRNDLTSALDLPNSDSLGEPIQADDLALHAVQTPSQPDPFDSLTDPDPAVDQHLEPQDLTQDLQLSNGHDPGTLVTSDSDLLTQIDHWTPAIDRSSALEVTEDPELETLESHDPSANNSLFQREPKPSKDLPHFIQLSPEAKSKLDQLQTSTGIPADILINIMIQTWDQFPEGVQTLILSKANQLHVEQLRNAQNQTIAAIERLLHDQINSLSL